MRPSSQRHARPAQSGFTILETVIALFIALVIGFGAISLFLFAASFNTGASDRARALALAQERMEGWRAKDFSSLAATTLTETVTLGSSNANEVDGRDFTVETKVVADTSVPGSRQFIITVTVTPAKTGGRFTAKEVTLLLVRGSTEYGNN